MRLKPAPHTWSGSTSARSVLVTVFGDSVVPIGGEVWLGHLFELVETFGYSERLIRTSMYRLVSEGWLESERVGRRSRYRLTDFAVDEFASAEQRIYHHQAPVGWNRKWTVVFTGTTATEPGDHPRLVDHLRWHGFAEISDDVWVLPEDEAGTTSRLLERLDLQAAPPTASAEFTDLEHLVSSGVLGSSFSLDEAETAYRTFEGTYRHYGGKAVRSLEPQAAFALRTMIVHDLRRARLVDPALPSAALPVDWIGSTVFNMAGELYLDVTDAAWAAVAGVTGQAPGDNDVAANRFA